jgi:antitoxin (DNA-binding transcriptional repressor) of toxin-antitoxin stability system
METTLTQLQRQTGRVADAIARREPVRLTRHGETIAEIQPRPRAMTGAEFAARWRNRKRLDKKTCDAVIRALKELDQAG